MKYGVSDIRMKNMKSIVGEVSTHGCLATATELAKKCTLEGYGPFCLLAEKALVFNEFGLAALDRYGGLARGRDNLLKGEFKKLKAWIFGDV
jgi:hypothetical protein